MRPTRQGWAIMGLAATALFLAPLLSSPAFLLASAALSAFLLATQVGFLRTLLSLHEDATVDHSLTPRRTRVDEPVTYRTELSLPDVPRGVAAVTVNPPVGFATTHDYTAIIPPDETAAHVALAGSLPTAGSYPFDPPTLTVSDHLGCFTHTIALGDGPRLKVEPRGPRDVHVGTGGTRIGIAYGEHTATQGSGGIEPSEIRRYLPGDPTNRIDWKATARLKEPHIREFEAETDDRILLFVDRRHSMLDGPHAETKLDYARNLSRWFVDYAAGYNDSLGLWTITEDGLGYTQPPGSSDDAYRRIRTHLDTLESTAVDDNPHLEPSPEWSAREAKAIADTLGGRDTAFDRTLSRYAEQTRPYVARVEDRPLYQVVGTALAGTSSEPLVVIVTDDERRVELRETVTTARRRARSVVVFCLPSVLFADRDATDLETAYDAYIHFENFRRDLAGLEDVTAYEVGPTDRLQALLATGRTSREVSP